MKVGTLVRWRAQTSDPDDFDDLGIVIYAPEDEFIDVFYVIQWLAGLATDHTPQMIEESLHDEQLEIIR